jgi:hypothetical protein
MYYSDIYHTKILRTFFGTLYSSFLRILDEDKKFLNKTELKQKKLASQNLDYFFCAETLIFHYGHKSSFFRKYFGISENGHLFLSIFYFLKKDLEQKIVFLQG